MNEQKKGEVWTRCGRCFGIGTVASSTGTTITCPECNGHGSKKIGRIKKETGLENGIHGRLVIVLDEDVNLDDFRLSIALIPMHLPISRKTGKPMALYEKIGNAISCRESQISVSMTREYISYGEIGTLNRACPEHQHENEFTLQQEILEPCDWTSSDEIAAETIYVTGMALNR